MCPDFSSFIYFVSIFLCSVFKQIDTLQRFCSFHILLNDYATKKMLYSVVQLKLRNHFLIEYSVCHTLLEYSVMLK